MAGTSSHSKVVLTNKGMKRVNSYGNGDHYVHIKVAVPKKLTNEQKALIQVFTAQSKSNKIHYVHHLIS